MTTGELDRPLELVLGKRTAGTISRNLKLSTVGELLGHVPRRYAVRGELTAISAIPIGETVTIVAEVLEVRDRPMRARKGSLLEVVITDGEGRISLTFFNQSWRANTVHPGVRGMFSGKITEYRGTLQLSHPEYELFERADDERDDLDEQVAREWARRPIPLYAATAALPTWKIHSAVHAVLESLAPLADPLPESVREQAQIAPYDESIRLIHDPTSMQDVDRATASLRFREAFLLQTALLRQRRENDDLTATARVAVAEGARDSFDASLPFELTGGQLEVGRRIDAAIAMPHPMNLLLQGEVGSGKTLVALRAMVRVFDTGGQSALLAPTEVLAAQHYRSIVRALGPDLAAKVLPVLITGGLPVAQRKRASLAAAAGQAGIVVGTHALLSDTTQFYDLGLVVVDEQHRFGVEQREQLRSKAAVPPHMLLLTATPIPRTIAMSVFGDLDVASLHELPKGRPQIASFVVPLAEKPQWIGRVWQRLAEEVGRGRQGYVVCSAIDESSVVERVADAEHPRPPVVTVAEVVEKMAENPATATLRVEALHGKMKSAEKDDVMTRFQNGDIDVLVATTVIEVGVDVPNASIMVVMDADRFGIAQLHQLRGRIGRGTHPSIALFVTTAVPEALARRRVEVVARTNDGFELAQADLELRHEGDVLGAAQSGMASSLKLLSVVRDADIIAEARRLAEPVVAADPALQAHPLLAAALGHAVADAQEQYLQWS